MSLYETVANEGEIMEDIKKKPPSCFIDEDLARDIAHFESLSEPELDAYLAAQGIDTEETVKAVLDLVKAKLDEWRDRGLLHAQAFLVLAIAVATVNHFRQSSQRGECAVIGVCKRSILTE